MSHSKRGKQVVLRFLGLIAAMMLFCLPVSAGVQEGSGEYEIYPTPQSVEYGTGTVALTDKINVKTGARIDSYTKSRIDAALKVRNLTKSETASVSNTDLIVGVYGSGDEADTFAQANGAEASLFEENDAYILYVKNGDIVIVGKNTDAAYSGVTTLKHILEQIDGKSVRELTVQDYADVEFRGFIEGYYGNPWSHEDRIDLMKFGSEIKMNQYVFAPKDDPYHNAKWRELYPEAELQKIGELAQAGNESKCFYVYALHPFMNNAINLSDSTYDAELEVIKAKFYQVISKANVRQIAILEDDASGETPAHMVKFLNDMNEWLHTLRDTEFPDLKTDILYCPTCYMSTSNPKLVEINKGVSSEIHIVMTGGKIWGEVTESFADAFYNGIVSAGAEGRYPYMWVNWPCNDNTKTSQIMGGHNTILHTGVTGSKYEGIILNPIQESEGSKVGIFTAADYTWKVWQDAAEGDQAWEDAFKYIDHMTPKDTETSLALKEVAKHMITQGPSQTTAGKQAVFEESVELSPKLTAFSAKLQAGTLTESDISAMKTEMQKIADAADLYLTKGMNRRTATQLKPFISCLRDVTQAGSDLMDALQAIGDGDGDGLWNHYSEAQSLLDQSQTYGFSYYGQGTIYAEAGRKYVTPFVKEVMSKVSEKVKLLVNPEAETMGEKYDAALSRSTGWTVYSGQESNITDDDDTTTVWYKTPGDTSAAGDFLQLDLGSVKQVGIVRAAVGADGGDKWAKYHVEYSADGENWRSRPSHSGNESGMDIYTVNLGGESVRYVKLVNDTSVKKWVKFSGFAAYAFTGSTPKCVSVYTNTQDGGWSCDYEDNTFEILAKEDAVLEPGEYVGLSLDRIRDINSITVNGTGMDGLTVEKSANKTEWLAKDAKGAARYIRVMNKTNAAVSFSLTGLTVVTNELYPMDLLESTVGGASYGEDARKLGTTTYWMDGSLSTKAKYCSEPQTGNYITYDLGQEITLRSLRLYVLDTAIDYPRDAVLQASADNENWTDLFTIGDGIENPASDRDTKPVESDCGYIHDTIDVAYAYIENADIDNVKARYIRMYFTAPYNSRWVEINELLVNGGEYIAAVNDPTFETDAKLARGYEPQNLSDGDLTTAFRPVSDKGTLTYRLSDDTAVKELKILQSGNIISNAEVSIRTDGSNWVEIGRLDSSYTSFITAMYDQVLDVKISWNGIAPAIYEIVTLTQTSEADINKKLQEELKKAQDALGAAQKELDDARSALKTAQGQLAAAATEIDKLKAELAVTRALENIAAAESGHSFKAAAVAERERYVLLMEAKGLNGAEAEARLQEAERKKQEAVQLQKLAAEKAQEKEQLAQAADKKQDQIDNYVPVVTPPVDKPEPEVTSVKYKNVQYKILSKSAKTAAAVRVTTKKVKSVTVYPTVKIGGKAYKVVQIEAKAFKGCTKLTKATIGKNVKKIGKAAFASCTKLKSINMKRAAGIKSIGKKAFSKISAKAKITVPKKQLTKYKKLLKKAGLPKKATVKK